MQYLPPRRIAAIHDLSAVGRCALTVIMPTLSVMGYQIIPVPTALLSTHTGGFTGMHFRNVGLLHLRYPMRFGAIYTGFLGSEEQIESVTDFLNRFSELPDETGKRPLVLIDPVMGDDGVLYSTYTKELALGMRRLSAHAEVLTPNLTEACLLTDTPFGDTERMTREETDAFLSNLLTRLSSDVAPRAQIVITGVKLGNGDVANYGASFDGSRFCVSLPHEGTSYPGTGDIFASVLLGELMHGASFENACRRASEFVAHLIRASARIGAPTRMGVALEHYLYLLADREKGGKV